MTPVDFLPGARRDFDESFDWYAARSTQAAIRFAAAIDAAIASLGDDPLRFSCNDGVHRECPLKRFPFRIVYRLVNDRLLIVAVAHAKRRPGYWSHRD